LVGQERWGKTVVGRGTKSSMAETGKDEVTALIGRKRKVGEVMTTSGQCEAVQENGLKGDLVREKEQGSAALLRPGVNVLGAGLVRKKLKTEVRDNGHEPVAESEQVGAQSTAVTSGVNILGSGLVRKKPKV